MIRLKKVTAVLLSALLVSSCMAPCTFAASKTKVGKINLTIDTDICGIKRIIKELKI